MMTLPTDVIALIAAVLSLIGMIYVGMFRQAKIEARVDLIWSFLLRQGIASSILGGLVERNSPLRLSVHAVEKHKDFVAKLKEWYNSHPEMQKLKDLDLFMALEKNFAVELNEVTMSENVLPGGTVAAALFLLRPSSDSFKMYDTSEWK